MDGFLRINKEFRNNFKEYLQQATWVAFQQIKIKGFDLSLPFNFLRTFNTVTPYFFIDIPVSIFVMRILTFRLIHLTLSFKKTSFNKCKMKVLTV